MAILNEHYTLHNGVPIPKIGFGTWQIKPGEDAYQAVTKALKEGYRHIDTAQDYGNEADVGRAIMDVGIKRDNVFVTSKLESHIKTYDGAIEAFNRTLDNMGFTYLDLFLIHAPWPWTQMGKDCSEGNVMAFKAMEHLYHEGKIRAIGVSNFDVHDVKNITTHCDTVPHVNQIAYFIGMKNDAIHDYCKQHDILVEGYSPLAIGYLLNNPTVQSMAKTYNVSPAQLCIRYVLERGALPISKSVHQTRIRENAQIDFSISSRDMDTLKNITGDPRQFDE